MENSTKLQWETPEFKVFGDIEDITKQIGKNFGTNDGLVYIIDSTQIGS